MQMLQRLLAAFAALLIVVPPLAAQVPTLDEERGVMTMAPLLERATPAVVNVSVQATVSMENNPLFRDPFFRRFFNMPDQPPQRRAMAAGSGVIVDAEDGYILSNHHVLANADEITVTLSDRRELSAELIGSDADTDIALLQVEAENLTALPIGDSDQLKVGDLVVAIGNPFGLGQTVTAGIVSALGRSGIGPRERYEDFIQTDAPINPGNSGGALVNTAGELIGINSAIIAPGGGNVGIGFAVPTNMARAVMEQLIAYGEVRRGRIGVIVQDLTPDLAEAFNLDIEQGAVVTQVQSGSPAQEAGLQAGDVITAVNGETVGGATELRNEIGLIERGSEVELTVMRDGEERSFTVEVADLEARTLAGGETIPQLTGARLSNIPESHPAHGQIEGVLVESVEEGSRAARAGLREGDIIVGVNRRRIDSLAQLQQVAQAVPRVAALNIVRGNTALFLVMP